MNQLKTQIEEIEAEMEALSRHVLEATQTYEAYLVMSGKYRAYKSVRDKLKDKLQKRATPDDAEVDAVERPLAQVAARKPRPHKARNW